MSRIRTSLAFALAFGLTSLVLVGHFVGVPTSAAGDPPPCTLDDELDDLGDCCELTAPQVPIAFPAVEQEIRYFTWNNCNLARNKTLCAELSPPRLRTDGEGDIVGCGTYTLPVLMKTCGPQALLLFSGELVATYSRTWVVSEPGGDPHTQVWRFMINGDLIVSTFVEDRYGTNPHLPQSYQDYGGAIHWFGFIDYRRDCSTLEWEAEWVLEHSCDSYSHGEGSERPGTYPPGRSFNFAGPSSFVPTTSFPHVVPAIGDFSPGFRQIRYRGNDFAQCFRYASLDQAQAIVEENGCFCGSSDEEQTSEILLGLAIDCGSFVFPTLPATMRKKVGYFEDPDGGSRYVSTWTGGVHVLDPCDATDTAEFSEGVETISDTTWNFRLTQDGGLVRIYAGFLDFATSNDADGAVLRGAPHLSRFHVNLNF